MLGKDKGPLPLATSTGNIFRSSPPVPTYFKTLRNHCTCFEEACSFSFYSTRFSIRSLSPIEDTCVHHFWPRAQPHQSSVQAGGPQQSQLDGLGRPGSERVGLWIFKIRHRCCLFCMIFWFHASNPPIIVFLILLVNLGFRN